MAESKENPKYWYPRLIKLRKDGWESPTWSMRVSRDGDRRTVNLLTSNKGEASRRAARFWQTLCLSGWGAAERAIGKQANPTECVTVGEWIEAFRSQGVLDERTLNSYAAKLRTIVGEITGNPAPRSASGRQGAILWREKIAEYPLSLLTRDAVNDWRSRRVKGLADPVKLSQAKRTASNYIRNARNLFSLKHLEHVQPPAGKVLPDPLPFYGVSVAAPRVESYVGTINAEWLIGVAQRELAGTEALKVLILGLATGMRRNEIDKLQWSQINLMTDPATISIRTTDCFKPKAGAREIAIDTHASTWLRSILEKSSSRFVVEGSEPGRQYRCDKHQRELIKWLRGKGVDTYNPIHTLRKEAGSVVNQKAGIHAASAFLGHANISLTSQVYVDDRVKAVPGFRISV